MKKLLKTILITLICLCSAQNKTSYAQYTIDDLNKAIAEYKNVFYSDNGSYESDGYGRISKHEKLSLLLERITIIDHTRVVECTKCNGKGDLFSNVCPKCGGNGKWKGENDSRYQCGKCDGRGHDQRVCDKCLGLKRILYEEIK